jgi:hypothetical protein
VVEEVVHRAGDQFPGISQTSLDPSDQTVLEAGFGRRASMSFAMPPEALEAPEAPPGGHQSMAQEFPGEANQQAALESLQVIESAIQIEKNAAESRVPSQGSASSIRIPPVVLGWRKTTRR